MTIGRADWDPATGSNDDFVVRVHGTHDLVARTQVISARSASRSVAGAYAPSSGWQRSSLN